MFLFLLPFLLVEPRYFAFFLRFLFLIEFLLWFRFIGVVFIGFVGLDVVGVDVAVDGQTWTVVGFDGDLADVGW